MRNIRTGPPRRLRVGELFGMAYRASYPILGSRKEAEDVAQEAPARLLSGVRAVPDEATDLHDPDPPIPGPHHLATVAARAEAADAAGPPRSWP